MTRNTIPPVPAAAHSEARPATGRLTAVLLLGSFLASFLAASAAPGQAVERKARITRSGGAITLGNDALELAFQQAGGRCRLARLSNKLSGRRIAVASDDFSIGIEGRGPLTAADFTFKEATDEAIPGGRRLVLRFDGRTPGTALKLIYELGDADFFARRRLELSTETPLALRRVDAWLIGVAGACSHQGFGEPVLLDDTFWGLEFPAAHNAFDAATATVRLTHFPGRTVTGKFAGKPAVVGVARKDGVARQFRRYVETFQATPKDRHLFVNYNTWWTLMPPTEKNCLELIATFKKRLYDPYGESFDTFTIDDGWDNKDSLWAIREDRFPRGFTPLVEELGKMHSQLGLWLSPSSGYSHAPWGAKNGYEQNSNPWFLCQSGPKYRRDIVPVVTGLGRKYNMAFFKFDGFCASCDAEGHGHLPGNYAREANVDAYVELLTAVRHERPDVFLDPTCGMWLSPWWLAQADSIWGSVSGDYPDVIVPAPVIRDSATTTRDAVFRQRCREHPGYPPAAIEHLGIIVITPEKWEDNAMAVLGRGCRLLTLYINPKFFKSPDRDWAFLASILKWVRHNGATLAHTELILGDPMKREPYGYAHFAGQRGIIALRNPFIEPRQVTVKLDETSGWERPEPGSQSERPFYTARIVHPREESLREGCSYGDSLELELQGYETLIVQVQRTARGEPGPVGVRHHEVRRDAKGVTHAVFGRPGQSVTLHMTPTTGKILLDGKRPMMIGADFGRATLRLPGESHLCSADGGKLTAETSDSGWKVSGTCSARVPAGTKATMYVLCDPKTGCDGRFACAATVGGKPVQVRALHPPQAGQQTHAAHTWTWFSFDVPAGQSGVSVTVKPADDKAAFFRGEVGWWLWAEHPLQKHTLVLEFDKPLPPAPNDPLPLPIAQDRQRQIVTIHAATPVRAGNRWPKLDRPSVRLDEAPPDEVVQDWGKLQRNQSVWEKPMIVAGRKFTRGLGTHANSRVVYELSGGKFKKFRCLVGRDEHAGDGRVVLQVWADGKKLFDSGPMQKATPAKQVEVDVTGAAVLELRTLDGGDGISGDHGNWADAELVR